MGSHLNRGHAHYSCLCFVFLFFFSTAFFIKHSILTTPLLLHKYKSHGRDVLFPVIRVKIFAGFCLVSTRVVTTKMTCGTKPHSGVTGIAVRLLISNDTDSCLGIEFFVTSTHSIEAFLVTIYLQRCIPNKALPLVTT